MASFCPVPMSAPHEDLQKTWRAYPGCSNTTQLKAPAQPGSYELRVFTLNNNQYRETAALAFRVAAQPGANVADPEDTTSWQLSKTPLIPNETFTVIGPAVPGPWKADITGLDKKIRNFCLIPETTEPGPGVYMGGNCRQDRSLASRQFKAPVQPGKYELRISVGEIPLAEIKGLGSDNPELETNIQFKQSLKFTVVNPDDRPWVVNPASVKPGDTFIISGPTYNPAVGVRSFLIVPETTRHNSWDSAMNAVVEAGVYHDEGGSSRQFKAPTQPGKYNVRVFHRMNQELASLPFTVEKPLSDPDQHSADWRLNKSAYKPSEKITITRTLPANRQASYQAAMAIVHFTVPPLDYDHIQSQAIRHSEFSYRNPSTWFEAPTDPGQYTLRIYDTVSRQPFLSLSFVVVTPEANATLILDEQKYSPKGTIHASFQIPEESGRSHFYQQGCVVGYTAADTPQSDLGQLLQARKFLGFKQLDKAHCETGAVDLMAPATPGSYEMRLYAQASVGALLARSPFTVEQPSNPSDSDPGNPDPNTNNGNGTVSGSGSQVRKDATLSLDASTYEQGASVQATFRIPPETLNQYFGNGCVLAFAEGGSFHDFLGKMRQGHRLLNETRLSKSECEAGSATLTAPQVDGTFEVRLYPEMAREIEYAHASLQVGSTGTPDAETTGEENNSDNQITGEDNSTVDPVSGETETNDEETGADDTEIDADMNTDEGDASPPDNRYPPFIGTLTTNKTSYAPEEKILASYTNFDHGEEISVVQLVPAGAPLENSNSYFLDWAEATDGSVTVKLDAPLEAGNYEVRLYRGEEMLASVPIKVGTTGPSASSGSLRLDRNVVNADAEFQVYVTTGTPAYGKEYWVYLLPASAPHGNWDAVSDIYAEGHSMPVDEGRAYSGYIDFTAPEAPGQYEIRLYYGDREQSTVPLTVR